MISYHSDKNVKDKYVNRMKAHIKADELIRGQGWTGSKGCAVGCTLNDYNHSAYETQLGIPSWLAKVEDKIFEGMPLQDSKTFPLKFLEAIPVGATNFEEVKWKFLSFIMKELIKKVPKYKISKERKTKIISTLKGTLNVLTNAIKVGKVDIEQAKLARSAAAAAYAAYAAADAAAAAAADAAAYAAAAADADAAYAAAAAYAAVAAADAAAYAAAADARKKAYLRYAKELLRLLKEMK